jgi:hypothetical protein
VYAFLLLSIFSDERTDEGTDTNYVVRKDITSLSEKERSELYGAMASLQEDGSSNGFQALASFHALPALCPEPLAKDRYACCVHGMATFPMWHRYVDMF